MNDWQNRITSPSERPLGSKSDPPLPPPIGIPVSAFLKICSKPRNLTIPRYTDGWKRRPPLYGPSALLNSTRKPRLMCTSPRSSSQGTRKMICRSGSQIRSMIFVLGVLRVLRQRRRRGCRGPPGPPGGTRPRQGCAGPRQRRSPRPGPALTTAPPRKVCRRYAGVRSDVHAVWTGPLDGAPLALICETKATHVSPARTLSRHPAICHRSPAGSQPGVRCGTHYGVRFSLRRGLSMEVTPLGWGITIALILGLLALDLWRRSARTGWGSRRRPGGRSSTSRWRSPSA